MGSIGEVPGGRPLWRPSASPAPEAVLAARAVIAPKTVVALNRPPTVPPSDPPLGARCARTEARGHGGWPAGDDVRHGSVLGRAHDEARSPDRRPTHSTRVGRRGTCAGPQRRRCAASRSPCPKAGAPLEAMPGTPAPLHGPLRREGRSRGGGIARLCTRLLRRVCCSELCTISARGVRDPVPGGRTRG